MLIDLGSTKSAVVERNKLYRQDVDHNNEKCWYDFHGNMNPLHLIGSYPHPKLFDFLASNLEFDVNHQDCHGFTPLLSYISNNGETM